MIYMMANRKNGAIHTGVSGYPERRVWQHKNSDLEGFTKRCDIKRPVWHELHGNPTTAIEREKRLKGWHRDWKTRLIEESNPDWSDLIAEISPV